MTRPPSNPSFCRMLIPSRPESVKTYRGFMSSIWDSSLPLLSPTLSWPSPTAFPAGLKVPLRIAALQRLLNQPHECLSQVHVTKYILYILTLSSSYQSVGVQSFHAFYCFSDWALSHWYRYFGKWPWFVDWSGHVSYLLSSRHYFWTLEDRLPFCVICETINLSLHISGPREKKCGV